MNHPVSRRTVLGGGALAVGATAGGTLLPGAAAPATAAPALIRPGADWRDTDGNLIEAHTGGMYTEGDTYYWVGANWQGYYGFVEFNLYASTNLIDWQFRTVLLENTGENTEPLPRNHEVARPKILYNAATDSYVMWFKRKNYRAPENDVRVAVATSPSLEGPWTYLRDFYPGEDPQYNTADCCLWQEPDGTAYYIASSPQPRGGSYERRIVMFRLTDDYLGLEPEPAWLGPNDNREAPAIFEREGTYYQVTSGTSGWEPNQAMYRTAPSITGPWSELRLLGDETAYGSQVDFVFPVQGRARTTYIYAGGRHVRGALGTSTYVWLPLMFSDTGELTLDFYPSWRLDTRTGIWLGR